MSAITVSTRNTQPATYQCVSEVVSLQSFSSPGSWLTECVEGPPLTSTEVSLRHVACEMWINKHLPLQEHGDGVSHPGFFSCVQPCVRLMQICAFIQKIFLWMLLQRLGVENAQFYACRSGGHLESITSTAAFLALYSFSPNYISCYISLPKTVSLRPCAWLSSATDGPHLCGWQTFLPFREHESEGLKLPFNPLAADWFLLDRSMTTKERLSPSRRSLDQIHSGTKQ